MASELVAVSGVWGVGHDVGLVSVRVMTWNVQNLFGPGEGDGPTTMAAFDAKLASLASVIDVERPHVLALQEVGTPAALQALQQVLGSMRYSALSEPDQRGIRVAFLSTRLLRRVGVVRLFPDGLLPVQTGDDPAGSPGPPTMNQLGRPALAATVRVAGWGGDGRELSSQVEAVELPAGAGRGDEVQPARRT